MSQKILNNNKLKEYIDILQELFYNARHDIVLGGFSGLAYIRLMSIDMSILAPLITVLLIPFLKELGKEVIIPFLKKKLKIKDK